MTSVPLPATAIAAAAEYIVIASGSTIHTYNGSTSKVTTIPYSSSSNQPHASALIRQLAISPDKAHLASAFDDKILRVYTLDPFELVSSRQTAKKCSSLSWTSNEEILVSDKVGDTYRYPLEPRPVPETKRTLTETTTDPSKNPDADLVLGHVSTITAHVLTQDGKRIITSDRDEHIRVSRYPDAYVIDKYLFGSNGFVSAIHIPTGRPELLLSAGGENNLRIWNWQTGEQLGQVGILEAILPYRKARSTMRKLKKHRKVRLESETGDGFYDAPEGWMLPSGQGVCIHKIDSVKVNEETVVLFSSEGATALYSFVLPSEPSSSPDINTVSFSSPVLDFLPSSSHPGQIIVTLDPAFGIARDNQTVPAFKPPQSLTDEQVTTLQSSLATVQVSSDGKLEKTDSDTLSALQKALNDSASLVPVKTLSSLPLYSHLSLYPRWPGFEEDDELAGTNEDQPTAEAVSAAPAASEAGTAAVNVHKKEWTREELEQLGPRQLGRLKASGVDVGNLLSRKKMKRDSKARRLAMEAAARENGTENGDPKQRQKQVGETSLKEVGQDQTGGDEEGAMNA